MIYEIYGKSRKTVFEFRKYDCVKDGMFGLYMRSFAYDQYDVRSHDEYETILLDTEETDWVYTGDDHITYEREEYKVQRVAKTLHEDCAKVYINYVKYLGEDEDSKTRAEAEKKLYEQGKEDGIKLTAGKIQFVEATAPARKRRSWKRFARV